VDGSKGMLRTTVDVPDVLAHFAEAKQVLVAPNTLGNVEQIA